MIVPHYASQVKRRVLTVWEGGDACAPPQPVGGFILAVVPVSKLELLALRPVSEAALGQAAWMGLVGLAGLAAVRVALVRKRRDSK